MELSEALSLVTTLYSDNSPLGLARRAKLVALLIERVPIIERLVAALRAEGAFAYVNPNLTSERCPTVADPSLDGARLEEKVVGSRAAVLAELKSNGRRSATVAEGLLYGLTYPEKLADGWIWCLDQVLMIGRDECTLVLRMDGSKRLAYLHAVSFFVRAFDRILSFPMTEAELVARDGESSKRRSD